MKSIQLKGKMRDIFTEIDCKRHEELLSTCKIDLKKSWWEQKEDNVFGAWVKTKDSSNKIFIGSNPEDGLTEETVKKFDVFLNVSDDICETFQPYPGKRQSMYWFPINEYDGKWDYNIFYGIIHTLRHHLSLGHTVYHHCIQGRHRSPTTVLFYLISQGFSFDDALQAVTCKNRENLMDYIKDDIAKNRLPEDLIDFCKLINTYPTRSLKQIVQMAHNGVETFRPRGY